MKYYEWNHWAEKYDYCVCQIFKASMWVNFKFFNSFVMLRMSTWIFFEISSHTSWSVQFHESELHVSENEICDAASRCRLNANTEERDHEHWNMNFFKMTTKSISNIQELFIVLTQAEKTYFKITSQRVFFSDKISWQLLDIFMNSISAWRLHARTKSNHVFDRNLTLLQHDFSCFCFCEQ